MNAVTYADMAWRGRAASQAPEQSIEKMAQKLDATVPGEGDTRENRLSGLGALSGIATGVAIGAAYGLLDVVHVRPGLVKGSLLAATTAILAANVPMAKLGISDPKTWSPQDWAADIVPHLAYGLVVAATFSTASQQSSEPTPSAKAKLAARHGTSARRRPSARHRPSARRAAARPAVRPHLVVVRRPGGAAR